MPAPYCGLDCLLHDHADGAFPIGAELPWLYTKNEKPIPIGVNLVNLVNGQHKAGMFWTIDFSDSEFILPFTLRSP